MQLNHNASCQHRQRCNVIVNSTYCINSLDCVYYTYLMAFNYIRTYLALLHTLTRLLTDVQLMYCKRFKIIMISINLYNSHVSVTTYCIRILTWNQRIVTWWYMYIHWTRVLYSVVITWQWNPPISQFNSPCNEFTSFWSMFVYKI